jgi:hypothetical protein
MVAMAGSKKAAGVQKIYKPSVPGFVLAAADPEDRRRHTSMLFSSRHSSSPLM